MSEYSNAWIGMRHDNALNSAMCELETAAGIAFPGDHCRDGLFWDLGRVAVAGTRWTAVLRWRGRRGRRRDAWVTDWPAWRAAYDDPSWPLSAGLRRVQAHLSDAIDRELAAGSG